MKAEYGTVMGDLQVSGPYTLYGMVTGDIEVVEGGVLDLNGMCQGQVRVLPGSTATVRGTVGRGVVNAGGTVAIHGSVHGGVSRTSGRTDVHPKAVIYVTPLWETGPCQKLLALIGRLWQSRPGGDIATE